MLFSQGARTIENIPPTQGALKAHINRAVFQAAYVWGQTMIAQPVLPSPADWGWVHVDGGWKPNWATLPDASKACYELIHCKCKKACLRVRPDKERACCSKPQLSFILMLLHRRWPNIQLAVASCPELRDKFRSCPEQWQLRFIFENKTQLAPELSVAFASHSCLQTVGEDGCRPYCVPNSTEKS